MFDFIEHVVYINLEHRTDRRTQIEEQLACFGSRVERLSAIYDDDGAIGCTKSHIAVLERAKEQQWKNVLIVEDDFEWKNIDEGGKCLTQLITRPYDVILFAAAYVKERRLKLIDAQTTTCYLVHNHYYDTLLDNFKQGLEHLTLTKNRPIHALDRYWTRLMRKDKWFIVKPGLGFQRQDYSDINKGTRSFVRPFF